MSFKAALVLGLASAAGNDLSHCNGSTRGQPLIIAHRGGSTKFPQSSLAAYRERALREDVDYLECDLTVTSDGVLLCQHEPDLTRASNANREDFRHLLPKEQLKKEWLDPVLDFELHGRRVRHDGWHAFIREDARPSEGWYTPDYTWNETISKLSAPCAPHQTCERYTQDHYPIATLDDLWQLASEASLNGNKRPLGLYLEVKHSTWHQSRRDIDLLEVFLTYLSTKSTSRSRLDLPFPLYIQSFEVGDLIRLRHHMGYDNRNVFLVGLSTILHTTYNLPPGCCTEDRWLQKQLVEAFQDDEDGEFVRLPGSFGEMFVSVTTPAFVTPQLAGAPLDTLKCLQDREMSRNSLPYGAAAGLVSFEASRDSRKFLDFGRLSANVCEGCADTAVTGLKIVPVSLGSIAPPGRLRKNHCDADLKTFIHAVMLSCPTRDGRGQTYSLANPPAAFDLFCFVDALGLDLRYVRKHPEIIQEAQEKCIDVHVWTVKTEADMRFVMDLGVDGVITDDAPLSAQYVKHSSTPVTR